jgi:hypothetical protein
MRITKKYAGASCLGRRVYHFRDRIQPTGTEILMARADLDNLEKRFRVRVDEGHSGGGSCSSNIGDSSMSLRLPPPTGLILPRVPAMPAAPSSTPSHPDPQVAESLRLLAASFAGSGNQHLPTQIGPSSGSTASNQVTLPQLQQLGTPQLSNVQAPAQTSVTDPNAAIVQALLLTLAGGGGNAALASALTAAAQSGSGGNPTPQRLPTPAPAPVLPALAPSAPAYSQAVNEPLAGPQQSQASFSSSQWPFSLPSQVPASEATQPPPVSVP